MTHNASQLNREILLSIVVPLFNEESNLDALFMRLRETEDRLRPLQVEFILVDDCSEDKTPALARDLCLRHDNVRFIRFAKNSGSHAAIIAGLAAATGDCVTFIAADLQDPPEIIPAMLDKWRQGISIVWAASSHNRNDGWLSSLYWIMAYHLSHVSLPKKGADFFLVDRKVVDEIAPRQHCNIPIFQLVAETGFKTAVVQFTKERRIAGKSGWTLKKKLALILETLLASPIALRALLVLGAVLEMIVILISLFCLIVHSTLHVGVAPFFMIIVFCLFTGLPMIMLGFVGEYLCVLLKEARQSPRFVIAERVNFANESPLSTHESTTPLEIAVAAAKISARS